MADTDKNPQRRELDLRRKRMEQRSTDASTGADGAAGQRDAGRDVGTANNAAQNQKPDMMLKYRGNGVLYSCAGGVRRGGTEPGCIARSTGGDPNHGVVTIADAQR